MSNSNANWRDELAALRGRRVIYEENRRFVVVDVIDIAIVEQDDVDARADLSLSPGDQAPPGSEPVYEWTSPDCLPEDGSESVISKGQHEGVLGRGSGAQLRLTLEAIDLPGFSKDFPQQFTVGGQIESMTIEEGSIHAYLNWFLTAEPDKVQAIIKLGSKGYRGYDLLVRIREVQMGRSLVGFRGWFRNIRDSLLGFY